MKRLSHSRSCLLKTQTQTQKPHVCLGACRTHMKNAYVILSQKITEEVIVLREQLTRDGRPAHGFAVNPRPWLLAPGLG